MTFTLTEMQEMMESTVGSISPRKLCGKCDYYSSQHHAGLLCCKCGGEFISVNTWTVYNLFQRVKPHLEKSHNSEEGWLAVFVAYYLHNKTKEDFGITYKYALDNGNTLKELYREYKKNQSERI